MASMSFVKDPTSSSECWGVSFTLKSWGERGREGRGGRRGQWRGEEDKGGEGGEERRGEERRGEGEKIEGSV